MTRPKLPHQAKTWARRAAAGLATYEGAVLLIDRIRSEANERLAYTVTVTDADPLYLQVHAWLLGLLPEKHHRALMVGSRRGSRSDGGVGENRRGETPKLRVSYNENRPRALVVDGHRVTVRINRPDRARQDDGYFSLEPEKIEFHCWTKDAQEAVLRNLESIHASHQERRRPRLMLANQWNDWTSREDLPERPLNSVVLPAAQKRRIVEDLRSFLAAENRYNELAVPWHRGYLFHGPPGTGKTSLVKALAHEFNLDLWYVSLSDIKAENSLLNLLARVDSRSMLLLEDIDTIQISHDRETKQGSISMSSLLNALDGVTTPHGLITVMTTNHFDRLDEALRRPGRMDVVERLGPAGPKEISALYELFYKRPLNHPKAKALASRPPAEVAETFKRSLDDPEMAMIDLVGWQG